MPVSVSWKECVQETVQPWALTWPVSSLNEASDRAAGNGGGADEKHPTTQSSGLFA